MLQQKAALTPSFIASEDDILFEFSDYIYAMGHLEWTGVAGFFCYVGAFGAVQLGKMDGNSVAYSLANIVAAILVGLSLLAEFNLASALIQTSWALLGLTGLALRARKAWPPARRALGVVLDSEVL